ncbi:MAG: hypothetical protein KY457_04065 [Actinobacteria bacterium]|nr:hypothetical protein [Actinomycetota bacterium]
MRARTLVATAAAAMLVAACGTETVADITEEETGDTQVEQEEVEGD